MHQVEENFHFLYYFERGIDMEERLKALIDEKIKHMDIHVDSICLEKEGRERIYRCKPSVEGVLVSVNASR